MLEDAVKAIWLVTSRATDPRSSLIMHDLKDMSAFILWPDGVAPPTEEELSMTAANYEQKKKKVRVFF